MLLPEGCEISQSEQNLGLNEKNRSLYTITCYRTANNILIQGICRHFWVESEFPQFKRIIDQFHDNDLSLTEWYNVQFERELVKDWIKEVRVKSNSQDWLDAEINEEIERRDKLLTKFRKSRSHSDNENYKKSRNKVQCMIKDKKKNFVIGKLNENVGKPKELWKSLKSLGLPSKANSSATICLEKDGILSFHPKINTEIFKDFHSNLANNLVKKLPTPQINMEKQQSIITTKN